MMLMNGVVDGDVILTVEERLDISDGARIGGDLKYSALIEMKVPEGVVVGDTSFNKFEEQQILQEVTSQYYTFKVISFISALVMLFLLAFLAPKMLISGGHNIKKNPFLAFGLGLAMFIGGILVTIVLMATVVGLPLGLIWLALLLIAFYLARFFTAVWLVNYIIDFARRKNYARTILFGMAAAALLVYYLVGYIPYVGWILSVVLFLIGLGGIALTDFEYFKFLKDKKKL